MKKGFWIIATFFPFFLHTSCKTTYQPQSVEFRDYRINGFEQRDTALLRLLKPYSDSVNKTMNDVVAHVGVTLEKKQPEGTLGNVVADAMRLIAEKLYDQHVDAAFMNYGGLRLTQIPVGPLTRGKVFELSPFDNMVVLLTVKGNIIQQFLDHIASKGGWPVSGLSMQIHANKAVNVIINGKPLEPDAFYKIATIDYIAGGGDNSSMLPGLPVQNSGYLFRDELIEYFLKINKSGKEIISQVENRVTIIP